MDGCGTGGYINEWMARSIGWMDDSVIEWMNCRLIDSWLK